jgi:regulator of RNase E activity RraA
MPIGGVNLIRLAMEASQEGDVLVLAARGVQQYAVFGGYISRAMSNRGLAAIVVDGAVRDSEEIEVAELPAFARGTATAACASEAPGEINVPVACGGVVVMPGDIVIGDRNGVVALNPGDAAEVLEKLAGLEKRHESWVDDVANGRVPGIEETIARAKELDMEFVAGAYDAR